MGFIFCRYIGENITTFNMSSNVFVLCHRLLIIDFFIGISMRFQYNF